MDYDNSGSGAWVMGSYPSTEYSLEHFFKYSPDIYHIYKSSGNADIFPPNIAVGKIYKIEDNIYYVKPFVNFKELEFVNVITNKL